jgi:hypothetical protein
MKESGAKPKEAVSVSERERETGAPKSVNTGTERQPKLTRNATSSDTSTVGKSITVVHGSGKTCQITPSELLDIILETVDRPRFDNVRNRPCPQKAAEMENGEPLSAEEQAEVGARCVSRYHADVVLSGKVARLCQSISKT